MFGKEDYSYLNEIVSRIESKQCILKEAERSDSKRGEVGSSDICLLRDRIK